MTITIKLFGPGETQPRFVGNLQLPLRTLTPTELQTEDLQLLWDAERAINNTMHARCHIEVNE